MTAFRTLFLRDSALWLSLFAITVQLGAAFYAPLTVELQGAVNAVTVALAGVITSVLVTGDRMPPTILGLVQAGFALALALGFGLQPYTQAAIMTALSAAIAAYVRTQVTSRVPPALTVNGYRYGPPREPHVPSRQGKVLAGRHQRPDLNMQVAADTPTLDTPVRQSPPSDTPPGDPPPGDRAPHPENFTSTT